MEKLEQRERKLIERTKYLEGNTRKLNDTISIKILEISILQDELFYYEHKNKMLESEIETEKDKLKEINIKWDYEKEEYECKIKCLCNAVKKASDISNNQVQKLEEALQAKSKQLVDHIDRFRG